MQKVSIAGTAIKALKEAGWQLPFGSQDDKKANLLSIMQQEYCRHSIFTPLRRGVAFYDMKRRGSILSHDSSFQIMYHKKRNSHYRKSVLVS